MPLPRLRQNPRAVSRHRDPEKQALIDRALRERLSLRGIFRVSLERLLRRIAALVAHRCRRRSCRPGPMLERDERYSFVAMKKNKRWLWVALCRRTPQVVLSLETAARRPVVGSLGVFQWAIGTTRATARAAYAKVFQTGRHQ